MSYESGPVREFEFLHRQYLESLQPPEPSVQINFRAPLRVRTELDAIALVSGLNRSDVLRAIVEGALPDLKRVCRDYEMKTGGLGIDGIIEAMESGGIAVSQDGESQGVSA